MYFLPLQDFEERLFFILKLSLIFVYLISVVAQNVDRIIGKTVFAFFSVLCVTLSLLNIYYMSTEYDHMATMTNRNRCAMR